MFKYGSVQFRYTLQNKCPQALTTWLQSESYYFMIAIEVIYKICLQLSTILFYILYQGPQPQMQIKYIYWQ